MNKKILIIGAGNWGKNLVRTFYELGVLAGIAETNPELHAQLQQKYSDVPLYTNYEEALQTEIDGVAIATPAHTHCSVAEKALRAGKDVFIEKPITLSSKDADKLIELANEKKRVLMVGHLLLYQPAIQELKRLVDSGSIGKLKSIHQERLKLGRVRAVENVLWSFGVHDVAVFLYLTGQSPETVQVDGQRMIQSNIEDDVYLHLGFQGNVSAHLHTSWLWPELRRRLTVVGTKGMIVYEEENQTLTLHNKGINEDLSNRDEGEKVVFRGAEQPLRLECIHFLECIATRKKPISDGENGLEVVKVLEQASDLMKGIRK